MHRLKLAIEERLDTNIEIAQIKKGFSTEQKFKVTTSDSAYLVRVSRVPSRDKKRQEFDLMTKLHGLGVRCNEPIQMFIDDADQVIGIYSYLRGEDAKDSICSVSHDTQYEIGKEAGQDLKRINSVIGSTNDWKQRRWRKHEHHVGEYKKQAYRFDEDERVLRFVETHFDPDEAVLDRLQHDDFHLGNLIVDNDRYAGVLDFNRHDWGDPLHEFVKLEWFSWPISPAFTRGQVAGYFGAVSIGDKDCEQISVYVAMSIFSTIVWTLKFWPETWIETEGRIRAILHHYKFFDNNRPEWST